MATLTITLSEEALAKLKEKAEHFRVTPEELLRASLEELLTRPDEDFERAVNYVTRKNTELYRRLTTG